MTRARMFRLLTFISILGLLVILAVSVARSSSSVQSATPNGMATTGEWIAFSCGSYLEAEIYIIRPDGSELLQVTTHGNWNGSPGWSPDGQWIVFASASRDKSSSYDSRGPAKIYKVRTDGTQIQQLTSDSSAHSNPVWSPNGQWIAFAAEQGGSLEIYRMDPDGSNVEQLTKLGKAWNPTWSPDGRWITFTYTPDGYTFKSYRMYPDGSNMQDTGLPGVPLYWSPDNNEVAFAYSPGKYDPINIYAYNWDNKKQRQLTHLQGINDTPTWSPDSQWIAFRDREWHLQKVKVSGGDPTVIPITNLKCQADSPAWFSYKQ